MCWIGRWIARLSAGRRRVACSVVVIRVILFVEGYFKFLEALLIYSALF